MTKSDGRTDGQTDGRIKRRLYALLSGSIKMFGSTIYMNLIKTGFLFHLIQRA